MLAPDGRNNYIRPTCQDAIKTYGKVVAARTASIETSVRVDDHSAMSRAVFAVDKSCPRHALKEISELNTLNGSRVNDPSLIGWADE